jgi:hypothetical protein
MDLENKEQALNVLPPAYRPHARIVQLNTFSMEQIDEMGRHHAD